MQTAGESAQDNPFEKATSSAVLESLQDACYEDLAAAVTRRLAQDRERLFRRHREVEAAERRLEEKRSALEDMERRIFAIAEGAGEVVELNVGGQPMSTTRSVLCSADGSLLAGLFSGNFEDGHKRDKEGRVFLDVDPPVFSKVLSHLRLRKIASPDCPAPLPLVPEEMKPEFDMMVKYYGLESFMYGDAAWPSCNIFKRIAEQSGTCQTKLQSNDLVKITLSSTGGVPASSHEEVLGPKGFNERALENSYGAHPNTISIRFLKHHVQVEAMDLRAKLADIVAHMSNQWSFRHGAETVQMTYAFTRSDSRTGRLDIPGLSSAAFVDEVVWTFPRDFCLEHIVLFGCVMAK